MAQETAVVEDVVGMEVMVGMVTVVGVIITTTAMVVATAIMAIHPTEAVVVAEVMEADFPPILIERNQTLLAHANTILHDQMCLKSPMRRHRINLM